jgi:dihydroorotase
LIRGGTLVDARGAAVGDVLIREGRIAAAGRAIAKPPGASVLDATGAYVMPALVDLHFHVRTIASADVEDLSSGTQAAALGGFCWVLLMPNTSPPVDRVETFKEFKRAVELSCLIPAEPAACISRGREGASLAPLIDLYEAGARFFTDDGDPVQDASLMRAALELSAALGFCVMDHPEERSLSGDGVAEGPIAEAYGLQGAPPSAEAVMVARDCLLAAETGGRYHAQHLSRPASLELISFFRSVGARVTCEVTPHHLAFCQEEMGRLDPLYKVNPPLAAREERDRLRALVLEGCADALATDHAPHSLESKNRLFAEAPFGISGAEVALSLTLRAIEEAAPEAPLPERLSLAVKLASTAPARIAKLGNLVPGALEEGQPASLVVFDPGRELEVGGAGWRSRGHNHPLLGKKLKGAVEHVVVKGAPVVKGGELV